MRPYGRDLQTVGRGDLHVRYSYALGRAVVSTIMSLTRAFIFSVALSITLPMFFGLDGLLYSFPVADILTFIIALYFIRQTYQMLSDKGTVNTTTQP